MFAGEILQRLGNLGNNFDRLIRDRIGEIANLRVRLRRDRLDAQALEGVDQSVREAVQAVSVFYDAVALNLVEHCAHLLGRKLMMVKKRNEARDGAFKINIVLPQRVVGVDEEGGQAPSSWLLASS